MHYTTRRFWQCYDALPESIQNIADQSYQLLKTNPGHPSLHFKKLGGKYWSVRVGSSYRAVESKWNLVFLGFGLVHTQNMTNSLSN
jgi:hypothetical protein